LRLEIHDLSVRFGALAALVRLSLGVSSGERRAVIGPNGAGKTTLFNAIAGDVRPAAGRVLLDGREVTRLPSWRRARLGLARTFQRSTLFPELTVSDNLALAVRACSGRSWHFWPSSDRSVGSEVAERLAAAGLSPVAGRLAAQISHGEQRALEIELALAMRPRFLLLDEPMAGLSGGERRAALERLKALPSAVTLVIVEHDLDAVFALAERISVLDHGVLIAEGSPDEVRTDKRVQEVYLGRP
jgi:ABC-type branched-subunit amino acid transport system ATPase component